MKCQFCGTENPDNARFCSNCGAETKPEAVYTIGDQNRTEPLVFAPEMPMKWYKFLIYFLLFATAALNAVSAVSVLTGAQYEIQNISADIIWSVYPAAKIADMIYGVIVLALVGYLIFTRFALSGYKKYAPWCSSFRYVITAVLSIGYAIACSIIGANAFDASLVMSFFISILFAVAEYVYFSKRKHLFVN